MCVCACVCLGWRVYNPRGTSWLSCAFDFFSRFYSHSPMAAVKGKFTIHSCPRPCCPHHRPRPWRDLCHFPCQTPNLPPLRLREGAPRPPRQVSYSPRGAGTVKSLTPLNTPTPYYITSEGTSVILVPLKFFTQQQQQFLCHCKGEQNCCQKLHFLLYCNAVIFFFYKQNYL